MNSTYYDLLRKLREGNQVYRLYNLCGPKQTLCPWYMLCTWKKISVITDISVFRFYRYIGYIGDISVDILGKNIGKVKIVKNS